MTGLHLYSNELDEDCYRVRLVASCLSLPLEVTAVDAFPGHEPQSERYLALNPLGRLPILTDGALTLTQTHAMLLHLAALPGAARRLLPADPAQHAAMLDWLFFCAQDLCVARRARMAAMIGTPGDPVRLAARARALLRIMEDHMTRAALRDLGFFVGADPSLADLALFPAFALSRDFNVEHDEFPELRLWARRVRRLPGFITMPGIPDYH